MSRAMKINLISDHLGKKLMSCSFYEESNRCHVKHGLEEWWDHNGDLWRKIEWSHGLIHGLWTEWYENGHLRTKSKYRDGKQHGVTTIFDQSGAVVYEAMWNNGRELKESRLGHPNTIPVSHTSDRQILLHAILNNQFPKSI